MSMAKLDYYKTAENLVQHAINNVEIEGKSVNEWINEISKRLKNSALAAEIMNHYGAEKQLVILAEECGELIQECCKCLRLGIPFSEDMVYEMADVIVMIKEFKAVFPEYYLDKLEETIRFKLQRQIERIENELGHEHKA